MMRPMSSQLAMLRERDLAGLRIDLHLADLRAVRPGGRRRRLGRRDADECCGCLPASSRQADRAVGAGDARSARRGTRCRRPPPRATSAASSLPRAITLRPAATTADPPTNAEREPTLPTPFARSVSPCTIRTFSAGTPSSSTDELRVGRLQALPHRLRAREHRHRPVGRDLDVDRLGGKRAGPLEVAGDPPAAQLAVAAASFSRAPGSRPNPPPQARRRASARSCRRRRCRRDAFDTGDRRAR